MRALFELAAVAVAATVSAQEPTNNTFDTQLKTVSIFKDGFGYYVREGKVKLEDGWATAKSLPTAVRGTMWVYPGDAGDSIDTLYSVKSNEISGGGADAIKKALANKIGLDVVVTASNKTFAGKLSRLDADMLMLDVGGAFTAITYGSIQKVVLPGFGLRVKLKTDKPEKVTTIGIAYVQEGARWEPSYILNMKAGGAATMALRGTVLNLPETLKNCDIRFVVGSPQLVNRGQGDTFTTAALKELEADKDDARRGQAADEKKAPTLTATPPPFAAGEGSGELYFYTKTGFNIEKGDTAMVTIFEQPTTVKPQYEWLADVDELTYILKIDNSSGQPFTDGPVFVVEDGRPLGQETIKFTPSGSTAELRLARGFGLRTEKTDIETGRGGVLTVGKTQFLPVKMKGTLKVTNFRNTEAPIKITRTVRGKMTTIGQNGVVKDTQVFTGDPNAVYKIEWNATIPANGTMSFDYEYETYTAIAKLGGPPVPEGEG